MKVCLRDYKKAPQIQWRQSEIEHRINCISSEQNNRLRNQRHGVRRKIKSGTADICRCSQLSHMETGQLSLSSSFSFRLWPKHRERFTNLPQQSLSVLQSQNAALSHYVVDRCGCGREDNSLVLPVFTDSHSQPKSTALPATKLQWFKTTRITNLKHDTQIRPYGESQFDVMHGKVFLYGLSGNVRKEQMSGVMTAQSFKLNEVFFQQLLRSDRLNYSGQQTQSQALSSHWQPQTFWSISWKQHESDWNARVTSRTQHPCFIQSKLLKNCIMC